MLMAFFIVLDRYEHIVSILAPQLLVEISVPSYPVYHLAPVYPNKLRIPLRL